MLTDALKEESPTFEEWSEDQDFEYSRVQSKVVDYVNSTLDHEKIEDEIAEASEIEGWDTFFEQCGIAEKEERDAAKDHIRAYVNARSS